MSQINDLKKSSRGSGKRGSTDNMSRLSVLKGEGAKRTAGNADWSGADPRWLAALIVAATRASMEVSFSLSADKGAYGLSLYEYATGERARLWFNGDANLDTELQAVFAKVFED